MTSQQQKCGYIYRELNCYSHNFFTPCLALADGVQRCSTDLLHDFSLDYFPENIARKTGSLILTLVWASLYSVSRVRKHVIVIQVDTDTDVGPNWHYRQSLRRCVPTELFQPRGDNVFPFAHRRGSFDRCYIQSTMVVAVTSGQTQVIKAPGDSLAQWVQRPTEKPGAILTRVRVPGGARDFSPRVNFLCRLSQCPFSTATVCNHKHQRLFDVKNPKHWQPYRCSDTHKYCTL